MSVSNLVASNTAGRFASILSGIPGYPIEDAKLSNIFVLSQGGGTEEQAAIRPAEKGTGYPEPTMFGPMPCYGFYLRHVKNLEMSEVEVQYANDLSAPPLCSTT